MENQNNPEFNITPESEVKNKIAPELADELEHAENPDEIKELLPVLLNSLESELGVELQGDVENIYKDMLAEKCLARIESLAKVVNTLEENELLHVGNPEEHYANAVVPDPKGLKIAFAEGRAIGPVRVIIGFGKTLIGFKTDNLSVDEIEFDPEDIRGAEERKLLCRHVSGDLRKEDIRQVVMRIPRVNFPVENMSDEEKKDESPFIFRGFSMHHK